ncbi:hypothetical protein LCY76_23810 [Fictibacillus sp. KIGAM418]|uniref:Type II secretion system protein GspF domain-containing protein n=1 Tax=Fictibacillus marinisediminis TaxID=2878389 RepID=A0A9X1XER4_9BACL|nr:hypothetical protein [Fictibacillus marinisediminis]MCK6259597.1 hypothetical protein [Fictibacillus marinisediminis]
MTITVWIIDKGIGYFLYFLVIMTAFFFIRPLVESPIRGTAAQIQYRVRLRKMKAEQQLKLAENREGFIKHLHMLLSTITKDSRKDYTLSFILLTSVLFLFTLLVMIVNLKDIVFSLVIGTFVASLPYLILLIRLRNIRTNVGNDLTPVVQMLIQNYTASNYDVYRALFLTTQQIDNKVLKKVFVRLISDMQISRGEEEIREAVKLFIYTCGNNWSKRLGNIVQKAYLFDERITRALLTLGKQMEDNEEMLEEELSSATDTIMNGWITGPLFIASLFLCKYVSKPYDYLSLQFENKWALLLFILSLSFTIASVVITLLLRSPKNDL